MENQKKPFIAVYIALALIVAALIAGRVYIRDRDYRTYLETGQRFLNEGNYAEAILAFNAAIEIVPKSTEAYIGRGDAYMGLERYLEAADDYEQALKLSNQIVSAYLGMANAQLELGDLRSALDILEEGADITGSEELAVWAEMIRKLNGGSGSLSGAVSEYLAGGGTAPLPEARVRLYVALEGGPRLILAKTTDQNGTFSLSNLAAGTYILHVDAPGHIGVETVEDLEENEAAYTELFLMIPETDAVGRGEPGKFYAYITNALNGAMVSGADVTVRAGWNNRGGETIDQVRSDEDGEFLLEGLDYGYYTMEITANGYVAAYHNVAVLPEEFPADWNLSISPTLSEGETRIVLTWGETPQDLDSHLLGEEFHVFFGNPDGFDAFYNLRANLDLDDTDSYGPETVTIYNGIDGVYTYCVHDFSSQDISGSTAMGMSGATVRVYQESGLVAEYHVPIGIPGLTWTVFRLYEDGTIETVNTMEDNNSVLSY